MFVDAVNGFEIVIREEHGLEAIDVLGDPGIAARIRAADDEAGRHWRLRQDLMRERSDQRVA